MNSPAERSAITSVHIRGFRGIHAGRVNGFTNLVVLVGPNGSGKSSLLNALNLGVNPEPGTVLWQTALRPDEVDLTARWLFFRGERAQSKITVAVTDGGSRTVSLAPSASIDRELRVEMQIKDTLHRREHIRGKWEFTFGLGGSGSRPNNLTIPFEGLGEVRYLEYGVTQSTPLHRLFTRIVERGLRDRFVDLIRVLLPKLKNIEILAGADKPVVYLVYENLALPAAMAGDGVHWLLRLACEVVSRENAIVLLEEPETHLHPGAMRQVAQVFRTAAVTGTQIFLTTHSLELIDAIVDGANESELKELSLYRMALVDGELKWSRLAGEDVAVARFEIASDLR